MSKIVDVIVPCFENPKKVLLCLDGFEKQTVKDFKLWLCMNGDPEKVEYEVSKQNFSFPIEQLSFSDRKNHGRPANRNQPLPFITAKYILYHDSDLVPEPTLLEEHLKLMEQKECISIGMVNYLNKDRNIWATYQYFSGRAKYKHLEEVPLHYLNTQNVLIPTYIIKELKGQDEALSGYGGDDTELGFRIQKHFDIKAILNRKAVTSGMMDKSFDKALKDVEQFGRGNFIKIVRKHPEFEEVYKIGHYRKSGWFRFLIHLPIDKLLRLFLFTRSIGLVHLLTVKAVYKGYKSAS